MKFKTLKKVLVTKVYEVNIFENGEPKETFTVNYDEGTGFKKDREYEEATVQFVTVNTKGILDITLTI